MGIGNTLASVFDLGYGVWLEGECGSGKMGTVKGEGQERGKEEEKGKGTYHFPPTREQVAVQYQRRWRQELSRMRVREENKQGRPRKIRGRDTPRQG